MTYIIIAMLIMGWLGYHNKGRFQLSTWMFNEEYDICLDLLIRKELRSGISTCDFVQDGYRLAIRFNSGTAMLAWNENRYYAWLQRGQIGSYQWSGSRPSAETMVKLRDAIKDYYLTK
jgi:hypothetical protein